MQDLAAGVSKTPHAMPSTCDELIEAFILFTQGLYWKMLEKSNKKNPKTPGV